MRQEELCLILYTTRGVSVTYTYKYPSPVSLSDGQQQWFSDAAPLLLAEQADAQPELPAIAEKVGTILVFAYEDAR